MTEIKENDSIVTLFVNGNRHDYDLSKELDRKIFKKHRNLLLHNCIYCGQRLKK